MGLVMGCKICTHRRKRAHPSQSPHHQIGLSGHEATDPCRNMRCSSLAAAAAFSFLQSYDGALIPVPSSSSSTSSKNRYVCVCVRTYMNLGGLQQRDATSHFPSRPTNTEQSQSRREALQTPSCGVPFPATPLALRCFMPSCLCPAASSSALWRCRLHSRQATLRGPATVR